MDFTPKDVVPETTIVGENLWTVKNVAQYLQLSPETIRAMARRRELPGFKIGRVWRFREKAIIKFLDNSKK